MEPKHGNEENPSILRENDIPYGYSRPVGEQGEAFDNRQAPADRRPAYDRQGYPQRGYAAPQYRYGAPDYQNGYGTPAQPYGQYDRYGTPQHPYGTPTQPYGVPTQPYGTPAQPYGTPVQPYGVPTQPYGAPAQPYGTPAQPYGTPTQPYADPRRQTAVPPQSRPVPPQPRQETPKPAPAPQKAPDNADDALKNMTESTAQPDGNDKPTGYAFKVRNLIKDYDGNVVLNNVSFDIPAGKIVGLLGPNGCGKTTLIKILAGLIHDYSGMIKIGGKPVGISSKASLAYLPDRTYFPERFRTIDCINYFADFFKDFDKVKAIEFASRFGLDLNQKVKTMSKGMQEKLQLLVVMSRAADIYLLDEPLGGVDPAARSVILDIIMNNYKKNSTVVLSTHLVNDLEHSFDHVLMLGHGQVLVNTGIDTLRSTGKTVEEIFKEVIGDAWEVE